MTAPPGPSPTPTALEPRQGDCQESAEPALLSVSILTREGRKVAESMDLQISQNRLQRIVRRFVADGRSDIDFRTWFIAYADPTGETAVRNVMRSQS